MVDLNIAPKEIVDKKKPFLSKLSENVEQPKIMLTE